MKIGLVGLPGSGKTTLFNLLTGAGVDEYPAGMETNTATAKVPDKRIDYLSSLYNPERTVYAQIDFTDLPGLNISEKEKKGKNPFLTAVRNVDALVPVIRVFEGNIPHILGDINPRRDLDIIYTELLFADWGIIEKRLERLAEKKKKDNEAELSLLSRCQEELESEGRLENLSFTPEEEELLKSYGFLTLKPLLVAVNLDEDQYKSGDYPGKQDFISYLHDKDLPYIEISALIEKEIEDLTPEDREVFLKDLGIKESGLDRLARAVYKHLGLISFFTVGEDEVKAWTIKEGTPAKKAAGKIHSDIERGFIRAEVVSYQDLEENGSVAKARDKGLYRLEGKEYTVKDGDIINFRFNV